jgi:DNA repair exonuclease SbcCD ATPase subunit
MIEKTLAELEARIKQAAPADERQKQELIELIAQLKNEIGALDETHEALATQIARQTDRSAQEATSKPRNPQALQRAIDDLSSSVTEFEKSHPHLVQVVNRIATTLSNLGI